MIDKQNQQALIEAMEQHDVRMIEQMALARFQGGEIERQMATPEQLLVTNAMGLKDDLETLWSLEQSARPSFSDWILSKSRHEKLARLKSPRVTRTRALLYEQPEIPSDENSHLSLRYAIAITDEEPDEEKIAAARAELDAAPEPAPVYLKKQDRPALELPLNFETHDTLGGQVFKSRWVVRHIHQPDINIGNPFGSGLIKGSFHDVDIFRESVTDASIAARAEYEERIQLFGQDALKLFREPPGRAHVYHLRINDEDGSLRKFAAIDEKGQEKDQLALAGTEDMDFAQGIIQRARHEIAQDLKYFKR